MIDKKPPVDLAICMGSSCFSRGNKHNIKAIKAYIDRHGVCDKVELKGHLCEGLCEDGPNISLDGDIFHGVDVASIPILLDKYVNKRE